MDHLPIESNSLKEKYEIFCPECKTKLYVQPSIFMKGFGYNRGAGSCLKCNTAMIFKINADNEMEIIMYKNEEG